MKYKFGDTFKILYESVTVRLVHFKDGYPSTFIDERGDIWNFSIPEELKEGGGLKFIGNDYDKDEIDHGQHYRFSYTRKLTQEEIDKKEVTINIDPFRYASICGITDFALLTVLKKISVCGNRGYKDMKQDIEDCICALKRKLEMLKEDDS